MEAVSPAGEQLMHIALMAYVPDDTILRRIEDPVQRHGQLHDAQIGGQVSTVLGYGADDRLAQLSAEGLELRLLHEFQVRRRLHTIELFLSHPANLAFLLSISAHIRPG